MSQRGVRDIPTLGTLTDTRRARTPYGAYLELAALALHKQRLLQERRGAERRNREIAARVRELECRATSLLRFIERPDPSLPAPEENRSEGPVPGAGGQVIRRREMKY